MKKTFLLLDVENLLTPFQRSGRLPEGIRALEAAIHDLVGDGAVLQGIAFCNPRLATEIAWELAPLGVRTFVTPETGPDAADRALSGYAETSLPASVEHVVIGSGDHHFTETAQRLAAGGRSVSMLALAGAVSWVLYSSVEHCALLDGAPAVVARGGDTGQGVAA